LLIGGIVGTTLGLFRALSAEEQAISAGKLATNNETKARSAVNRYFTLVSEETLLDMPGFQPLREKLLEEARKYYEELLQQRSNDPVVQAELAVAYFRMGEIYQATGKGAEFIAAFQTGFELVEQLVHENPGDTDLHRRLAGFWTGHRRLHLASTTNLPKSNGTAILQKVAIQWQRFVDDNPNVPEFQSDLAAVFGHLSELHYQKPQELISWQKKALAIRTKLVSAYPSRPLYRADQAVSHVLLGIFSSRVGKRDEAVKHLRAAIGFLDELATEFTKVPIYREGMGIAKRFLSSHVQAGEYEKLWRESLQLYGDLVAEFPTVPSYHHGHAESSFYVGRILASAKQLQEAERAYQLSWQLYGKLLEGFPEYGDYLWGVRESHAGLIKLLNSSGRTQDAITVSGQAIEFYEKLHAKHPKHIGIQADLVRVYVLRSGALQKSGQPGETEKALRRAVDLARPLVTATPTLPRYRTQFFELTHELDRLLRKSGQLKQAEELVREAITTLEKEIGDGLLSTAHHHLSSLLTQANRLEEAEVHLRKALEVAEKEAIKSPKSADAWGRIAHHSRFLAWHLKSLKRFAEAERVFVNALNGYYKAAAKSTGEAVYGNRYFAADTHWNLADVIRPQSRPKEEEAEYRKGVELFFTLPAKSLTDGAGRDTANRCVNSLVELLSAAKRLPEAEAMGFTRDLALKCPRSRHFVRNWRPDRRSSPSCGSRSIAPSKTSRSRSRVRAWNGKFVGKR
jgi:tetratricopeptide (TPR) repeat protein